MKTIVVFYSLEGNTKAAAESIAKELNSDILEIKPVKAFPDSGAKKFFWGGKGATFKDKPELEPYEFNAADYDVVIIGTPLWAGTITPPIRTFLTDNSLKESKTAVFISCGGGSTKKGFKAVRELTGKEAFAAEVTLVDPAKNADAAKPLIEAFCKTISEGSKET